MYDAFASFSKSKSFNQSKIFFLCFMEKWGWEQHKAEKIRSDNALEKNKLNLLNFSISQLNVHEQTKLSLVHMGVLMVYGFTLWLAKGALLIYCHTTRLLPTSMPYLSELCHCWISSH